MKGIKTAVLIGLACCVGAASAVAKQTNSQSKSTRSEKTSRVQSAKKKRSASAKPRKSRTHAASTRSQKKKGQKRLTYAERFTASHFPDLPPEDLPEPEAEGDVASAEQVR
ncbi:MAG TPA: hypothetical protein VG095_10150 [Chthoniobacterales bacterium]|nr:hypothetical protein [Chthoniobacterales bacterium]